MVYQHGVAVAPVMQNTLPPRPEPKHDHGSMAHNHGSTAHSHSHNAAPHTHEPIIPPHNQPRIHTAMIQHIAMTAMSTTAINII